MFSKKICASLCALGLSLGAADMGTKVSAKVSAANTFADIAMKGNRVSFFYNYFRLVIGVCGFMLNRYKHDTDRNYGGSGSYEGIAGLTALTAADGFFDMISSLTSKDEARIKTFEAMAKNDPVYGNSYKILVENPIKLSDENVKGVIDNVRKCREAVEKFNNKELDAEKRLSAKDEVEDAIKNLEEIAGAKNSKSIDKQNDSNEPQLYKRRNG